MVGATSLKDVHRVLLSHQWVGSYVNDTLYEVKLCELSEFMISHTLLGDLVRYTNDVQPMFKIRITRGGGRARPPEYYIDTNNYVLPTLADCLRVEEVNQYNWLSILPQPIAEAIFPKTNWHARIFRRAILLARYRNCNWRKKHGILRVYVKSHKKISYLFFCLACF